MNIAGSSQEERTGSMIAYILTALFGWLGGLIGWLVWKGKGSFAKDQTTEAFNFGLTTLIALVVLQILARFIPFVVYLIYLVVLAQLILGIMGAIAANKGESYRFPFSLRLIK
jgi:uncharacterized Tic20 family protein